MCVCVGGGGGGGLYSVGSSLLWVEWLAVEVEGEGHLTLHHLQTPYEKIVTKDMLARLTLLPCTIPNLVGGREGECGSSG